MDELREAVVDLIKEDDDFYSFIVWSLGTCLRKISIEIKEGRDDEITNAYNNLLTRLPKGFFGTFH